MAVGQCPSCGAPVHFQPGGGKVRVCEHCHTVVLRGEARLEDLGKVADLLDTESPLQVGLSGRHSGTGFAVVGRIQKANPTGTWDEWCLAFEDGRSAWLSESEGAWNLMFPLEGVTLPSAEALAPLFDFSIRGKRFRVEEVDRASTVSAEGQLPEFNREHLYADCTGPAGVFASLDYADGGPGEAFVGSRVTLEGLGFDEKTLVPRPRHDSLSAARCTNCNGMLELKAPDSAKRVACPYCGALLDVSHGTLAFLQLLEKPPHPPLIPLGTRGSLEGSDFVVLAFLLRSCTVEGTRYPWDEYLLYNRAKGFRWLLCSNGHWSLLTPIGAGEVELSTATCTYRGTPFRIYQSIYATTEHVMGECYWAVQAGEVAKATEYIAPPFSISADQTDKEVTFTHGRSLEPREVAEAFKLTAKFPTPEGIAPAQINRFRERAASSWAWSAGWAVLLLALLVAFSVLGNTATYFSGEFRVPPGAASGSPEAQSFSEPFEILAEVPLEVTVEAPDLANSWLGVGVDVVNTATGEVVAVYGEPQYYFGFDEGESWSEGNRRVAKQTAEVDRGSYIVRVTPQFDINQGTPFRVSVKADDTPWGWGPLVVFLLLLAGPVVTHLRAAGFETRRWADSVFQNAPGVDFFPHAKNDDGDTDDD